MDLAQLGFIATKEPACIVFMHPDQILVPELGELDEGTFVIGTRSSLAPPEPGKSPSLCY